MTADDVETIRSYTGAPKVKAIGEIGLDYYWDKEPEVRENQKRWFKEQLRLSAETGLPFIVHSRDAAKDTYDILKEHMTAGQLGVVHCFSYPLEMAKRFLDLGLYIGIGGVVTFKNSREIKEVAAYVPMDRLLLETDCPYLSPIRGKRNDSRNLGIVAEAIAGLKGTEAWDIIGTTCRNALEFYRIEA
ncbi:MAG: TatD family hydrolase [Lachnospiraceae bacterium]|nr:TatD family hydrolase [Lachnospiraceae bacterium]